ncbi:MAG: AMP-binding protein [Woeseiaceae bacterium]|nr:AMP-binding protein [Woeseiaceae bacterium]
MPDSRPATSWLYSRTTIAEFLVGVLGGNPGRHRAGAGCRGVQLDRTPPQSSGILRQLRKPSIASRDELLERLRRFADSIGDGEAGRLLGERAFSLAAASGGRAGQVHAATPADLAFIQYSSGSTSDPKGVCLTHRNVCSTCDGIIAGLELTERDRTLSWMPLTHDMGLIGYHVTVMIVGMDHAIMDTPVFIRRPLLWLQQASELGSTVLCSPNFGYRHFLKVFERKDARRNRPVQRLA